MHDGPRRGAPGRRDHGRSRQWRARGDAGEHDRPDRRRHRGRIRLQILVEKDPDLLNYIAIIRINPARLPKVNVAGALRFADWLVSEEAQRIIQTFGVDRYGEPLFFPNAAGRAK
jgi:ABC-type tungstate transport system permease subunit